VVELVALEDAEIKYSTVQNWYPGDENGKGGIYNFVTKRGDCRGNNSKISWTQVETGSAITWKYPSCILRGDDSWRVLLGGRDQGRQQADTGTKMIHLGKNTSSAPSSPRASAPATASNTYRGLVRSPQGRERAQPHPVRLAADRRQVRRPHLPVHRGQEPEWPDGARGDHLEDRRRPALLLPSARPDEEDAVSMIVNGFCKEVFNELPDGVRRRGAEAAQHQPRGASADPGFLYPVARSASGSRASARVYAVFRTPESAAHIGPSGRGLDHPRRTSYGGACMLSVKRP
jgi:Fe-S cluster assembly protein SufB